MAASKMIVVVSSSDAGRADFAEADPGPPAGTAVEPGAPDPVVVDGAVVLAVGGTVPAGTDVLLGRLAVALPGVAELACPCPGA